jgi:hypothetical protein
MCEFCSTGPNNANRDQFDPSFAGFFSPAAIENAVRRSRQNNPSEEVDDEDSDGT